MKLHHLLFYFLILFLPTQLGRHFWPDWAQIYGIRIDYLSPTIYLTDILILGILGLWGVEKLKSPAFAKASAGRQNSKILIFLAFITIFLLINISFSQNLGVAFYKLIKILELGFLGFYIAQNITRISQHRNTIAFLSFGIIYQSLIAIFQFLKQGSLGGIFWFLGERTFNAGTPGIAQVVLDGRLVLRSYATFPHPNVLGGFLAVTLPLLVLLPPRLRFFPFILGTIALFLTFSRSSWLVFGLSLSVYGLWFLRKNWSLVVRRWKLIILLVFIGSILFFPTTKSFQSLTKLQPESIKYRQDLNLAAIKMIKDSPLFGVGLGNFLVRLPEFYQEKGPVRFFQPTHNVYLLIAAETGLVGLGLFLWFLILTYKRLLTANYQLLIALSAILVLGFFDHYFYTLQQGQLLFTLLLGLAWSSVLK